MDNIPHLESRRTHQSKRSSDERSEYERDEARLIHSAAFRRLQSKTQVLGLGESDFYRTRLTHSMEVAQIGRGIVKFLQNTTDNNKLHLPDSALISAICLAHDIGHPPFGHGGEVALNYCMRNYGGFEGNAQTLRILSKLEKYTEDHGLNPTKRMLLGVLKYPVSYNNLVNNDFYSNEGNQNLPYWLFKAKTQKPPKCYYDCDQDIINFILDGFNKDDKTKFTESEPKNNAHSLSKFKSLDCSIMNLSDNISYSLHDLEDALSLGMIIKEDWEKHFDNKHDIFNILKDNSLSYDTITSKLFGESNQRKDAIGTLVNLMITNTVIVNNNSGCEDNILKLNVQLKVNIEKLRVAIFDLVVDKVIKNVNVQQLEFKGQKLVIELFQALSTDPERFLPKMTLNKWNKENNKESKMRVICDFISGMTDDYAIRFYDKLFSPNKGSIFDRL